MADWITNTATNLTFDAETYSATMECGQTKVGRLKLFNGQCIAELAFMSDRSNISGAARNGTHVYGSLPLEMFAAIIAAMEAGRRPNVAYTEGGGVTVQWQGSAGGPGPAA